MLVDLKNEIRHISELINVRSLRPMSFKERLMRIFKA